MSASAMDDCIKKLVDDAGRIMDENGITAKLSSVATTDKQAQQIIEQIATRLARKISEKQAASDRERAAQTELEAIKSSRMMDQEETAERGRIINEKLMKLFDLFMRYPDIFPLDMLRKILDGLMQRKVNISTDEEIYQELAEQNIASQNIAGLQQAMIAFFFEKIADVRSFTEKNGKVMIYSLCYLLALLPDSCKEYFRTSSLWWLLMIAETLQASAGVGLATEAYTRLTGITSQQWNKIATKLQEYANVGSTVVATGLGGLGKICWLLYFNLNKIVLAGLGRAINKLNIVPSEITFTVSIEPGDSQSTEYGTAETGTSISSSKYVIATQLSAEALTRIAYANLPPEIKEAIEESDSMASNNEARSNASYSDDGMDDNFSDDDTHTYTHTRLTASNLSALPKKSQKTDIGGRKSRHYRKKRSTLKRRRIRRRSTRKGRKRRHTKRR